jgi:hypothetical protein
LPEQGQSPSQIAKTIRRSYLAVYAKMKRLGFYPGKSAHSKLTLTVPGNLLSYLEAAARRRRLKTEELAAKMLQGVLRNSTIDGITKGLFLIDH